MEAASYTIRKSRGVIIIEAHGLTPRGQKYVKKSVPLSVKSIADPRFKAEMAAAIEQIANSEA